jgi:hypothetical protein
MIQMINNGMTVNKFSGPAKMIQPAANIGILTAPTEVTLVESVYRNQILSPNSHVAPD